MQSINQIIYQNVKIVCYWKQLSIERLSQINRYSQILDYYVGIDKDEVDVHIQVEKEL